MGCLLLLPFFSRQLKRGGGTQSYHRSSMQSASSTPTFFPFFSPSEVERGGGEGKARSNLRRMRRGGKLVGGMRGMEECRALLFYSTALSTQAFMQPWPVGAVLPFPFLIRRSFFQREAISWKRGGRNGG